MKRGEKMHRKNIHYQNIDMQLTGLWLKRCATQKGYSAKDLQHYLQLSCPQPVYRWFKGQVLPSVNHLYCLGRLLEMHMEALLVPEWDAAPMAAAYIVHSLLKPSVKLIVEL